MPDLLKSAFLLERAIESDVPVFRLPPGEDGLALRPSSALALNFDAWEDMGRPDEITVTIEPGDTLNEETPGNTWDHGEQLT